MSDPALMDGSGSHGFLILLLLLGAAAFFGLRLLRRRMSLGDIAGILALALIAPLTVLLVQLAHSERQAAISTARDKLILSSRAIAQNTNQILERTKSVLTLLILAPETYLPDDGCDLYLTQTASYFRWVKALALTNEDGEVICASNKNFKGMNVRDHGFFSGTQSRRRFFMSEVVSLRPNDHGIVAALPLEPGRQKTGIIFTYVNLEIFAKALTSVAAEDATHITLIDGSGRLLARYPPLPEKIGQVLPDTEYILRALGKGSNFFHARGPKAEQHMYATQHLDFFGGVVIVGRRRDDVLQPIDAKLSQRLILIATLIATVMVIGYIAGQRLIFRPLQALADFAFQLESGHLDARLTIRPKGEIGQVCKAFDVMAQALAKRDIKLRETGSLLSSMFNSMRESIFVFHISEANEIYLADWNAAAAAETGVKPIAGIRKNLAELLPLDDTEQMLKDLAAVRDSGEPMHFEYTRKADERTWEGVHVPIKDQDGKVWCLFTSRIEVTERKRAERMKREFVSTVSHELRTPLTAISGSLGLMLGSIRQSMTETEKRLLRIAYENSLRLVRLVNDILDIEKIEAGRIEMDIHPIALDATVKEALEQVAGFAQQYGVVVDFQGNCPGRFVCADEDRLAQIITNLVSNAVKFSPPGETVVVRTGQAPRTGFARISVIDRGPGIPASFQPRLFTKFAQADTSDSRQKGGTGLGLAICKELVDRLGGALTFETAEGKGTTFHVDILLTGAAGTCQADGALRSA